MQLKKNTLFFFFLIFTAFHSFGQTGNLRVTIYHEIYTETPCFNLIVYNHDDTVYTQSISDEEEISIDSLAVGYYSVKLTNCGAPSDEVVQSITKTVDIKDARIAILDFDFSQYTRYIDTDTLEINDYVDYRTEVQLGLSYFDSRWNPDGDDPKFTFGFDYSFYNWLPFSKHVGFLIGGGMGYMFAPLQIDTDENALYLDEIKSQYYNYFNFQYDMKLRFSTLNQQRSDLKAHSVFFDIGAVYNLPFYFKRTTRFSIKDKMVNSFIHRYSDLRFYVNVGFTNVQVFASYRPFDIVRADYPQLPKFNTGIKFNIHLD